MRPGMLSFQDVGRPTRTDEREDVHVAAFHKRGGNLSTAAVNEIYHAGREACRKGPQQGLMQQHAEFRRLYHRGVAHDERRDQRGVHFVQRVVERPIERQTPSGARRTCAITPPSRLKREFVRSTSFSASTVLCMYCNVRSNSLPLSHISRFTTSWRTINISAANVSTAAMRADTLIVGHVPRPWSQALTAAF